MITIHVSHPLRPDVTRQLVHLAGGDRSQVAAATAGVTVSDDLALKWLAATQPPASNGKTQRPLSLATEVRDAEQRAGIGDPDAQVDARVPATGSGTRASRSARKTTAPPPEE